MNNSKQTFEFQLFQKTGGIQPTDLNPSSIDRYFLGNHAKIWAMNEGYISHFKELSGNTIKFNLTTDPRVPSNVYYVSLCNSIAKTYRDNIDILRHITNFEVSHFLASDIIGYNVRADETEKLKELSSRAKQAHDTMPKEPKFIHFGTIK